MTEQFGYKRLKYLKQVKRKLWSNNPICFVCKLSITDFKDCTTEHIVPRSQGGGDNIRNLAISHAMCNQKRSNTYCRLVWSLESQIPKEPKIKQIYDLTQEFVMKAWKEKYQIYNDEFDGTETT